MKKSILGLVAILALGSVAHATPCTDLVDQLAVQSFTAGGYYKAKTVMPILGASQADIAKNDASLTVAVEVVKRLKQTIARQCLSSVPASPGPK
jgi:hypothetical protein